MSSAVALLASRLDENTLGKYGLGVISSGSDAAGLCRGSRVACRIGAALLCTEAFASSFIESSQIAILRYLTAIVFHSTSVR